MGIDISAKLIYGCMYSELPEEILEEVDEMLDNGDLEYASPYYDAPRDAWIVGVSIDGNGISTAVIHSVISEVIIDYPDVLKDVSLKFYVSPHVY